MIHPTDTCSTYFHPELLFQDMTVFLLDAGHGRHTTLNQASRLTVKNHSLAVEWRPP